MSGSASGGSFISFEGIDGAGKSTHIASAADWLRARGHAVRLTREPGGTTLAEALRALVLGHDMDALTETLLIFAARRDHLRELIAPALARGETVLCDRFTDATFAYQGGGRGFPHEVMATLEAWVQEGVHPALTLWFDLPAQVAAARRSAAREADRFEREDAAFFGRVREGYLQRQRAAPQRIVRIDADQPREDVWRQVEAAMVAHR